MQLRISLKWLLASSTLAAPLCSYLISSLLLYAEVSRSSKLQKKKILPITNLAENPVRQLVSMPEDSMDANT
jgi:hypothetical protein